MAPIASLLFKAMPPSTFCTLLLSWHHQNPITKYVVYVESMASFDVLIGLPRKFLFYVNKMHWANVSGEDEWEIWKIFLEQTSHIQHLRGFLHGVVRTISLSFPSISWFLQDRWPSQYFLGFLFVTLIWLQEFPSELKRETRIAWSTRIACLCG